MSTRMTALNHLLSRTEQLSGQVGDIYKGTLASMFPRKHEEKRTAGTTKSRDYVLLSQLVSRLLVKQEFHLHCSLNWRV